MIQTRKGETYGTNSINGSRRQVMTLEQINERIKVLTEQRQSDAVKRSELMVQQELKKSELNTIQVEIDKLNWVNKPEAKELEELEIAKRVLES